jgi:hypothetical protein
MENMKRKLTFNESSEEKKLRSKIISLIISKLFFLNKGDSNEMGSSIENLSNEIFYEIFDYLDGLDIYLAFSNLNYRFEQLLTCSSIRYKINLYYSTTKELFLNNYKQIKHQIYSINFQLPKKSMNELLTIDCSFNNLQSILIGDIQKEKLISLLIHLSDFPSLYSLDIKTTDSIEDLNHVYELIFSLPKLKSNKLNLYGNECSISIPMSNNKQISPIEYLNIAHSYTFDELCALISYTPKLRHLNLSHSNKDDEDVQDMLPIDLDHLEIFTNCLNFDEFEIFIEKMNSKLKILNVVSSNRDITYLDANRWQELIEQNIPQLEKFSLRYRESGYGEDYPIYDGELNQFISTFWIQRNLIFDIEIYEYNIYYYVRSYK